MGETGHLGEYSPVKYDSAMSSVEEEAADGAFSQVYMKSIIFGSTDGVCFSMVVVSAAVGCGLGGKLYQHRSCPPQIALSLEEASSSAAAHRTFMKAATQTERWNYKRNRKLQIDRLSMMYQSRGMSRSDADLLSNKMSSNENFFISQLVSRILGCTFQMKTMQQCYLTSW